MDVLIAVKKQSAEFDALENLVHAYQQLKRAAPVDDDYPEFAFRYQVARELFLRACEKNAK